MTSRKERFLAALAAHLSKGPDDADDMYYETRCVEFFRHINIAKGIASAGKKQRRK